LKTIDSKIDSLVDSKIDTLEEGEENWVWERVGVARKKLNAVAWTKRACNILMAVWGASNRIAGRVYLLFEVDRMVIFATAQNFQGVISCYVPRRAFTAQLKKI
tara:strand:+ start:469 stop:780 length:312 start_codon:yes stop_codon:yes gene_type:complete